LSLLRQRTRRATRGRRHDGNRKLDLRGQAYVDSAALGRVFRRIL
jgi:hypothetical protein